MALNTFGSAGKLPPDHGGLLVVDDEPFLRDAVAASLRFLGFEVTTGQTAADALRLARDRPFDLIVLDVMLPDGDGFNVVRRLRRDGCVERSRIADPQRTWQARIASGLVAVGDEELLCRAMDNLLANVHTHTPEGTTAVVTAYDDGDRVVVEVSDNGPGVPAPAPPYLRPLLPRGHPGPAPRVRPRARHRHRDRRDPRRHRHGRAQLAAGGCASPSPCPPGGGPRLSGRRG